MGCKNVTLTDHPECCGFLQKCVSDNLPTSFNPAVDVEPLDWTCALPARIAQQCPWDVIICSDLLYFSAVHVALCETLLALVSSNSQSPSSKDDITPQVLFSYESRNKTDEKRFFELAVNHFYIEDVIRGGEFTTEQATADCDSEQMWILLRLTPRGCSWKQ